MEYQSKSPSQSCEQETHDENSLLGDRNEDVNDDYVSGEETVDEFSGLSEYEKNIMRNIRERNNFLIQMGFPEMVKDLSVVVPMIATPKSKKIPQKIKRKSNPTPKVQLPRRESRRIRRLPVLNAEGVEETIKIERENDDVDEQDNRILGTVKVEEGQILCNLTCDSVFNPTLDLANCSTDEYRDQLLSLKLLKFRKVMTGRIQSIATHPSAGKPIMLAGDIYGNFGIWDALEEDEDKSVKQYRAHRRPLNCISVARNDDFKVYTTSHDGTIHQMDFNLGTFTNIFATEPNAGVTHLTWHDEFEDRKFLVAHGIGDIGILDSRAGKQMQEWIDCFPRSARTVQHHPSKIHYFLVSSGTGSFKIFDMRNSKDCLSEAEHPKTLSSAFFSSNGKRIVSTCADDKIRVFDSTNLGRNIPLTASYSQNNNTGRWLTPFRASWAPKRDDIFHVGSLLSPRRINFYKESGGCLMSLTDEHLTTINSAIAMHPMLPIVAGANSSGKVYLFGPPSLSSP